MRRRTRPYSLAGPDGIPLVGRDDEIEQLVTALNRGVRAVVVRGSAGIGKTTLLRRVASEFEGKGWAIETAAGAFSGREVPLAPFLHLLGDGAPSPGGALEATRLVRDIRARTRRDRILFIVDDAQHLDPMSVALLDQLRTSGYVALIVAFRSGEHFVGGDLSALVVDEESICLDLEPLTRPACDRLVELTLGGNAHVETCRVLAEQSAGNPLLLRELIRMGMTTGALTREGAYSWTLVGDLTASPLLREIVAQRLAALTEDATTLVVGLALAGSLRREVATSIAAREVVAGLERSELLRAVRDGAHEDLELAHPLYGETALDLTTPARVRIAARRVATALREHGIDDVGTVLLRARLCLRSGDLDPNLLTTAAMLAARWYDASFALECAEAALSAGGDARAQLLRAIALSAGGRVREADPIFAALADSAPDAMSRATLVLEHANSLLYYGSGDVDRAVALLRKEISHLPDEAAGTLRSVLTFTTFLAGRSAEAIEAAQPLLSDPTLSAVTGPGTGYVAAQAVRGRPDLAIPVLDRGFEELRTSKLVPMEWMVSSIAFAWVRLLVLWQLGRSIEGEDPLPGLPDTSEALPSLTRTWLRSAQHFVRGHVDTALAEHGELRTFLDVSPLPVAAFTATLAATGYAVQGNAVEARAQLAVVDAVPTRVRAGFGWWTERARALTLAAEGDISSAVKCSLALTQTYEDEQFHVTTSFYDLVRLGRADLAVVPLVHQTARSHATWWDHVCCDHALALLRRDPRELVDVSARLEAAGLDLYAAEALAQAEKLLGSAQDRAAVAAVSRHRGELLARCGRVRTPAVLVRPRELTEREAQVARLAAAGLGNAEIARRVGTSARTIGNQLQHAFEKLGVHDRRSLRDALTD